MELRSAASDIILPNTSVLGGTRKRLFSLVPTYVRQTREETQFQYTPGEPIYFPRLAEIIQQEDAETLNTILQVPREDVELVDRFTGTTILHLAASRMNALMWETLANYSMIEKFLDEPDLRGTTPLIAATWYQNGIAVQKLVEKGADPRKAIHDSKKTSLHVCAEHDSESICKTILKDNRSAEILNELDVEGNTPLMISVIYNSDNSFVFINAGADYTILNPLTGRHILHLAVIFSNYKIQSYCTSNIEDVAFLDHPDINDDSPLSLAMTIRDEDSVDIFLESPHGKKILHRCQKSLHGLVIDNQVNILEALIYYKSDPKFYDVFDENGRTPLLLAVELMKIKIVKLFSNVKVNFETRNCITGETVLHIAAKTLDEKLIEVVFKSLTNIEKISSVEDNLDITAYEIILAGASYRTWQIWVDIAQVEFYYENSSEESALYIAAKGGNYVLVLSLLLSRRFKTYLTLRKKIDEYELLDLEVKRAVYASDIFITLGLDTGKRGWMTSPKQDHLFQRNTKGMNIFHACALGGNLDCIRFIYNYCKKFKQNAWQIDAGDENGNTPLFFAVLCGWTDIAKYLLQHGCNMARVNVLGWSPLHAIAANDKFHNVLEEVISESAKFGSSEEDGEQVIISFDLLQPQNPRQMEVIWSMYENLRSVQHIPMLTNPVIEFFVLYKWQKIKHLVSFKLFMFVLLVFSYTMYLSLKLCLAIHVKNEIIMGFRYLALLVAFITFIFNVPLLLYRKSHFTLFLLAPATALCYLHSERMTREGIELAAYSVLSVWLAMIMGSYITKLNYQLAVLQKILYAVIGLLPLSLMIITGFSLCFFTLFHDYVIFNNPLRAFFTIAIHMREGELKTPVFPSVEPMIPISDSIQPMFQSEDINSKTINNVIEVRNILIEGFLFVVFKFLVIICTFNLLVDAAIKGVTEVEGEGKLQKLKNYVQELALWELVLNSKAYTFCNRQNITWLMGLPKNLRNDLRIPPKVNPLHNPIPEFDTAALKWMAFDRNVEEKDKKFFKYMWEDEERETQNNKKKARRASTKPFTSSAWRH